MKLISVCMITYGHEKYIREAVESVLMQKTNFPIELILANDCSPDNTDHIVKDILTNHPNSGVIKYIKQSQNIGMMPNFLDAMKNCNGEYIAFCEGDDYWTDEYKLQKQFDFFELNPDVAVTYHDSIKINSINQIIADTEVGYENRKDFTGKELQMGPAISTRTVCFINKIKLPKEFKKVVNADTFLFALLGEIGNGKYIENIKPSVYRIHDGGIFSGTPLVKRTINKYRTYYHMNKYFNSVNNYEISAYYLSQLKLYLLRALYLASQENKLKLLFICFKDYLKYGQLYEFKKSLKYFLIGIIRGLIKK